LYTAGLALDYCVAFSCKDGVKAGFNVFCVKDACRHIAADSLAAENAAMLAAGVHILESADEVPTKDIDAAIAKGVLGGAAAAVDMKALLA